MQQLTQPDARAAGRGALALIVLQTASRLILTGFIVVATRTVQPSQFGRYSTFAAILFVAGFVSDFGTTSAITKVTSAGRDSNSVLHDAMSACILLGVVAYGLGCCIAALVNRGGPVLGDFAIGGLCLLFDAALTSVNGALDGEGKSWERATNTFLRGAVGAVVAALLLVSTGSIRLAIGGLATGSAVALGVSLWTASRHSVWDLRLRRDPRAGAAVLRVALPFALISGVSVIVARIDVLTLAALRTPAQTASYDLALRAVESAVFPVYVATGPMLYLFARRLAEDDVLAARRAFGLIAKAAYLVALPLSTLVPVCGPQAVRFVLGPAYAHTGGPLVIMSSALFIWYISALEGVVLTAIPGMRSVVALTIGIDVLAIIIQVPLIVWKGVDGAAVGLVGGLVVAAVLEALYLRRRLGVWLPLLPPVRLVAAAVLAGAIALVLRSTSLFLALAVAGVAYGGVVLITRAITAQERSKLFGLLASSTT
jgi:O-antigen/teichoic acid export membrane protein